MTTVNGVSRHHRRNYADHKFRHSIDPTLEDSSEHRQLIDHVVVFAGKLTIE
jgi:hypothetical protein